MGLLSYFQSPDKADEIPLRSKREHCWEARDQYYTCLDKIDVENALDPRQASKIKKHCSKEEAVFADNCAKSWIDYFKEKRFAEIKKAKMLAQAERDNAPVVPLPGTRS